MPGIQVYSSFPPRGAAAKGLSPGPQFPTMDSWHLLAAQASWHFGALDLAPQFVVLIIWFLRQGFKCKFRLLLCIIHVHTHVFGLNFQEKIVPF